MGAFKLCKKNDYATETLHCFELFHRDEFINEECEEIRWNHFVVMPKGVNAVSYD